MCAYELKKNLFLRLSFSIEKKNLYNKLCIIYNTLPYSDSLTLCNTHTNKHTLIATPHILNILYYIKHTIKITLLTLFIYNFIFYLKAQPPKKLNFMYTRKKEKDRYQGKAAFFYTFFNQM